MPPKIASIHLVGAPDSPAHSVALETAQRVFPGVAIRASRELADALAQPAVGAELLILLGARSGDIAQAAAALDARGLARWAIIARGTAHGESKTPFVGVQTEDWNAPVLGPTFLSAAALHALERENARLRGDLRTVSRRLAHDLRTPLNCISTASEALGDPDGGGDPATAMFAQSITTSVEEAVALVERLSVVFKATANPPALQPVTMEEIVWGTLQRLESRIQKTGAVVTKPKSWPAVVGVPAWIDVIWVNLILNSLQHAGAQPRIELGWERAEAEHRFWLRDSGRGVLPERREHLFYPLDRLSELNAPRGYGLPIVQRLVELQGGRSGYELQPAPGGSFFFTLRPT